MPFNPATAKPETVGKFNSATAKPETVGKFNPATAKPETVGKFNPATAKPESYKPAPEPSMEGAVDIAKTTAANLGTSMLSGYAGMILGRDTEQAANIMGQAEDIIPQQIPMLDQPMGDKGKEFQEWMANLLTEAYQDYVPDDLKPFAESAINALKETPETIYSDSMDTAARLDEKGLTLMADVERKTGSLLATAAQVAPEAAELLPFMKAPSLIGLTGKKIQRLSSDKRDIAEQLERGLDEGKRMPPGADYEPGTELVPYDPWGEPPSTGKDVAIAGPSTSTAKYQLTPSGRLVTNQRYKQAEKVGISDSAFTRMENDNTATRSVYLDMVKARENLAEFPQYSDRYDPSIVTGRQLKKRFDVVHDVNKKAGKAIDKYVNQNLATVAINPRPLMTDMAARMQERGVSLDPDSGALSFGELELSEAGMRTITAIFDRVKQDVSGRVTGKSIHNFKRIIDEKIAYGKQVDGLDAKTQSVLRGMRESARSFLEDRFPEYAAANLEYSKTIDVINRIQKAASKNADLDGDYAFSNLGRMSRAIMSQRQSRDAVLQAIDDMDVLAKRYGRNFQDDIRGQVWFANYLDDEFGSSRQTGFSGQVQQGVANAAADLATGSAGIDVKGFMNKIWTKRIEDKNKFKIMKQLLKDNP